MTWLRTPEGQVICFVFRFLQILKYFELFFTVVFTIEITLKVNYQRSVKSTPQQQQQQQHIILLYYNKKLHYREEHSAPVVLNWCTL